MYCTASAQETNVAKTIGLLINGKETTVRAKEHRTTEEEMGGPTSPGGLRNRQHA